MRGLRNAVGFVSRPGTSEQWATNNGRDHLGDDMPPETVYRLRDGGNAGWPHCIPPNIPDPQLGRPEICRTVDPPAAMFQAHTAPLGLRFYDGKQFPESLRGDLFVALHGSWNRSTPIGYKVIRIPFASGSPGPAEDFATGWMATDGNRGSVWGRPVDVLVAADGALLVSDDDAGAIYRIAYSAT
jgi:glucose/arabinose dehydrogenase